MGVMNEAFGASEQQVPVDGNLKCVRVLALAGKTRALVSLTSAGKEHHVWVQSISKLATSAVGIIDPHSATQLCHSIHRPCTVDRATRETSKARETVMHMCCVCIASMHARRVAE